MGVRSGCRISSSRSVLGPARIRFRPTGSRRYADMHTAQEARPAPHPRRRRRPDHNPSSYGASRTPAADRTTDGTDESPAPERDRPDHRHQAHSTVLSNAATEGYNRLLKQVKRVGCGFRNREHSARRIRFHCTRKQRAATQTSMLIARSKLKSRFMSAIGIETAVVMVKQLG